MFTSMLQWVYLEEINSYQCLLSEKQEIFKKIGIQQFLKHILHKGELNFINIFMKYKKLNS